MTHWRRFADTLYNELVWSGTPEGGSYWVSVYDQARFAAGDISASEAGPRVELPADIAQPPPRRSILAERLIAAGDWENTPQGPNYWLDVYGRLTAGRTYDPALMKTQPQETQPQQVAFSYKRSKKRASN